MRVEKILQYKRTTQQKLISGNQPVAKIFPVIKANKKHKE